MRPVRFTIAALAAMTAAAAPAVAYANPTPVPIPTVTASVPSVPVPSPSVPVPTPTVKVPTPRPSATAKPPAPRPSTPKPKPTGSAKPATASPSPSPSATVEVPTPPAPVPVPQDAAVQPKAGSRLWGVDVASWQHPHGAALNWASLKADSTRPASFAFVKSSEGTSLVNDWYARDVAAAKKAGWLVGAYHYARPGRPVVDSAKAQAAFAVKARGGKVKAGELPLVLDLESNGAGLSPAEVAQWALTWLAEVERLSGTRPIVYTYPSFFRANVAADPAFARYPLWIANYGRDLRSPTVPAPWTRWDFWQFSAEGDLDGVATHVDLNVFSGSAGQLQALAKVAPAGKVVTPDSALLAAGKSLLDGLLGPTGR